MWYNRRMSDSKKEYEKAVDFLVQGKSEEAVQVFHRIVEQDPKYTDAYESLGMTYYKMGKLDEAIRWTAKLTELCPDHAMAHTNLSIFYMKKGMKEKAEEEKAKATVLNFGKAK